MREGKSRVLHKYYGSMFLTQLAIVSAASNVPKTISVTTHSGLALTCVAGWSSVVLPLKDLKLSPTAFQPRQYASIVPEGQSIEFCTASQTS